MVVNTDNRQGALSHLVRVLAEGGVRIGYTYATTAPDDACVVLSTDDNPRAEDLLRTYLILPDAGAAGISG